MEISGIYFEPKLLISRNYNVFNEGWDGHGSYMCSGLYISNTWKLPIYIGGSETLQTRIESQHIPKLKSNKHENNVFQKCWNIHNLKEGFVWWLLESCDLGNAWIIEQQWLNYYRPFVDEFGGFNVAHDVLRPMLGRYHSQETKKKLSECKIGNKNPMFGGNFSEEHKRKISKNHSRHNLGKKSSPETCNKISKKQIGRKLTTEWKQNISESISGEKHPMFGKEHKQESKEKMSNSAKLRDHSFLEKAVKQIDLKTGEVIKIWKSATEAAKTLGLKAATPIYKVLGKETKSSCGFYWEYNNE